MIRIETYLKKTVFLTRLAFPRNWISKLLVRSKMIYFSFIIFENLFTLFEVSYMNKLKKFFGR